MDRGSVDRRPGAADHHDGLPDAPADGPPPDDPRDAAPAGAPGDAPQRETGDPAPLEHPAGPPAPAVGPAASSVEPVAAAPAADDHAGASGRPATATATQPATEPAIEPPDSGVDKDAEARAARRVTGLRIRPEILFLPLFLIVGAVFIALVPPGWNSDEPQHFLRGAQLAGGQLLPDRTTDPNGQVVVGGDVPMGVYVMLRQNHVISEARVFDANAKVTDLYADSAAIAAGAGADPEILLDFRNTAVYSPVAYAPGLVAFWIGNAFSLSYSAILILGRVFALLVVAAATFFAIRITPIGKWAFFVVGLLPAYVGQAVTFSADPMVLATCVLFAAVVLRFIAAPAPPTVRQWILLGVLAALVPLTKVAYAPLLAMILLIPLCGPARRTWRAALLAIGVIVVALIPALLWTRATGYANVSLNPAGDLSQQLPHVLSHPLTYLRVLYSSFLTDAVPGQYTSMFGNFVWLTAPLPALYILLAAMLLLGAVLVRDDRESFELASVGRLRLWRYGTIAIGLLTALAIATGIYVTFSSVFASTVEGFQTRYLLPLLPPAMAAVSGNVLSRQRPMQLLIVVGIVVVLIGAILTLVKRLY